jgi:hypothetical protein
MNKILIHNFGKIKLDKDGIWYHNDVPFSHTGMIKLFNKSIVKTAEHNYILKIDKSEVPIDVEDVILWITDIEASIKRSELCLFLSNETSQAINQTTELQIINNELYCNISQEKAKFTRKSFNHLTKYLAEENGKYFFQIGSLILPITEL